MGDDFDLSDLRFLRLFPLPGVIFFPHAILPLHIFEPRYRQVTEDALKTDRFVTIVDAFPASVAGEPARLAEFGCVGRIVKHERLPDGRFNFLLHGLARVRLIGEVPSGKMYRTAEVQVLLDPPTRPEDLPLLERLADVFRRYLRATGNLDPDFEEVLASDLTLGELTDIVSHSAPLSQTTKGILLGEGSPLVRARRLCRELAAIVPSTEPPASRFYGFPPPFSSNRVERSRLVPRNGLIFDSRDTRIDPWV